jgi:hypothetical protein
MSRRTLLLFAATSLLASSLGAQGVEYASGTMKYHISTTTKVNQTSPLGNAEFDLGIQQRYTVKLARQAKDTVRETVTVDSISVDTKGPAPDIANLQGSTFTALLSPTGTVYSTTPPPIANQLLSQLTETVARFLPVHRGNLRPGATWSDTVSGKMTQQGMEVSRTSVADFTVLGDTTVAGEPALRVKRVTKMSATGKGMSQDTPIALVSSALSDSRLLLTANGVYLGGSSNDDITYKVTMVGQNAEINVKQLGHTIVEVVR